MYKRELDDILVLHRSAEASANSYACAAARFQMMSGAEPAGINTAGYFRTYRLDLH